MVLGGAEFIKKSFGNYRPTEDDVSRFDNLEKHRTDTINHPLLSDPNFLKWAKETNVHTGFTSNIFFKPYADGIPKERTLNYTVGSKESRLRLFMNFGIICGGNLSAILFAKKNFGMLQAYPTWQLAIPYSIVFCLGYQYQLNNAIEENNYSRMARLLEPNYQYDYMALRGFL